MDRVGNVMLLLLVYAQLPNWALIDIQDLDQLKYCMLCGASECSE